MNKSIVNEFLSLGKNLTILDGKRPVLDNWPKEVMTSDDLFGHDGNLGWVLGEGDLVIDVDTKNGGGESYNQLCKDLNVDFEKTVKTPSGGFHIYLKYDHTLYRKLRKILPKEYPGIDFLTKGAQCVIPSSVILGKPYKWANDFDMFEQLDAPESLLKLLTRDIQLQNQSDLGDFEGLIGQSDMDESQVIEILSKLDPSMGNSEWVTVGMALHHWHPKEGLRLWEEWSKEGENYDKGETSKRWRSFKPGHGVTIGSLIYMGQSADITSEEMRREKFIERIKKSDASEIKLSICKDIIKSDFDKLNREALAKAIQSRLKDLFGAKPLIRDVRMMITQSSENTERLDIEKPEWLKGWVLVNHSTVLYNVDDNRIMKPLSFNMEHTQYTPLDHNGYKQSAMRYCEANGFIEVVDEFAYLPMMEPGICTMGAKKVANVFDKSSIPVEAESFTDDGLEAIQLIKNHLKMLCNNDTKVAKILLQWIAHQVQYPGKKIPWAPVIQSIQGVGKTLLAKLMANCVGGSNVGIVSPQLAMSNFNDWATNRMINVLEELKVVGHNRYEAANALKPLVSDETVTINPKGMKSYQTLNTTNYIVFTNYKDAIPLDDSDRRWWVVFVPLQSLKDIKKMTGIDHETYFRNLWNAISIYKSEIRKWLLEYPISDEFKAMKVAPMTEYKQSMIMTEKASHPWVQEIEELIEKGGKYFNKKVISSKHLFEAAMFEIEDFDLKDSKSKHKLLTSLGYTQFPSQIRIGKEVLRIWMKTPMGKDEVQKYLNKE